MAELAEGRMTPMTKLTDYECNTAKLPKPYRGWRSGGLQAGQRFLPYSLAALLGGLDGEVALTV